MAKSSSFFWYVLPLLVTLGVHYSGDRLRPVYMLCRNCFFPAKPADIRPVHGDCSAEQLSKDVTIVVSVKDSCSQAPGFLSGLELFAPKGVHVIYTYPNFTVCDEIDISKQSERWDKFTTIPLPVRSSPMQGWVDAIQLVDTKYTLLLHNDGYALDDFFLCELVNGLRDANAAQAADAKPFVVAAPMLYESKHDGSLAAHATQTNLRIVPDGPNGEVTVRHDHSLSRALNRGFDFEEGDQSEFLEDHGFLIETDKIIDVVDPGASFTLEYIDMIMSIRSHNWKVLFVPTSRLEFRITEFSWRDIPYFVYKRSEITAHGTRDYLAAKWKAMFPNTGFWTYIKYTIVEQHAYRGKEMDSIPWKDQAAIAYGFMQMMGFNRYRQEGVEVVDFIQLLHDLDNGWVPEGSIAVSRELKRPDVVSTRPTRVNHLEEILPYGNVSKPSAEADMPLEYLPFAGAELKVPGKCALTPGMEEICGLVIQDEDECTCWINLPTFKSNAWYVRLMNHVAALVKIPSRVTTYLEMVTSSTTDADGHVKDLRVLETEASPVNGASFRLLVCNEHETYCPSTFKFTGSSRVVQFVGKPFSAYEVLDVLSDPAVGLVSTSTEN